MLFTIIIFLVVFSILVFVHEFGHFIVAKRSGIKVEEFAIGFGPKIWKRKKGDTVYSVGVIPFGGFVRLYGMDTSRTGKQHNLKNFSHRSMRTRVKVMVAGVVMNLLLAWVLISFGFMVGMEPLLGQDDVFTAIDNGVVKLQEGAVVKSVEIASFADGVGLKVGDAVFSLNGGSLTDPTEILLFEKNPIGKLKIMRSGKEVDLEIKQQDLAQYKDLVALNNKTLKPENVLGAEFYNALALPRVDIYSVDPKSGAYKDGLRNGDIILAVNGIQTYTVEKYLSVTDGLTEAAYTIYRDGVKKDVIVKLSATKSVIVSGLVDGMPAKDAGVLAKDIVFSVGGKKFNDPASLIDFISKNDGKALWFDFLRAGKHVYKVITPKNGKVGIYLLTLFTGNSNGMSLYNGDQYSSVIKIFDEKYPVYSAPFYGLKETYRLTKLTGTMFADFFGSFFTKGEVPQGVSGPIGIAQMTGTFAREGFIPLIRFVALLSISLAVLNILPIPALDGGKLLFILIEFVIGKKVPAKWENYVHMLGYFLILLLVVAVTYQDILRSIGG